MPRLLKHNEINFEKWDNCISYSENPLIYGLSWYLDAATNKNWDGIVWGNYEAVLPLPINKKLFLKQVFTPSSIRCLEVFRLKNIDINTNDIEYHLQSYLNVDYSIKKYAISNHSKKYQTLNLNKPYEELKQNYRSDRVKDLKKAKCVIVKPIQVDEYNALRKSMLESITHYKVKWFLSEYAALAKHNCFEGYKATIDNEAIAVIGLTKKFNQLGVLSSATNKLGYKHRAFIKLVDFIIQKYSNTGYILNFMGSNIDGIRTFNLSFGAEDFSYYKLERFNKAYLIAKQILKKY